VLPEEISLILRQYQFDVIHFNNGIHGTEYSDVAYGDGLRDMISILRKYDPRARLLWATTTPIRVSGRIDQLDSSNSRAIRRNAVAAAIMKQTGIPTDDLYNLVLDHPEYYQPDGIHFNEKGVEAEAKEVARQIAEVLPR
jgi:lysophospholipase L1-like esterase